MFDFEILYDFSFSVGYVALKELNFVSPTPSQFQAFRNEVLALKFVHLTFLFCSIKNLF